MELYTVEVYSVPKMFLNYVRNWECRIDSSCHTGIVSTLVRGNPVRKVFSRVGYGGGPSGGNLDLRPGIRVTRC